MHVPHHPHSHTEMAPVNGGKIILSLEINLILFYVGAAGKCVVSVWQEAYLEVDHTYDAITMGCSFSAPGCPSEPPTSLWFRYGANQAEKLYLGGPESEADKFKGEEALEKHYVYLTVNRVTLNDSGIYICGIAYGSSNDSKAKQTGAGTTLVVRETKVLSVKMKRLLAALLFLLSLYIIGVAVVFVVLSKETPPAGESKSNSLGKKETEDSQKKKSARRIFQEIAQELYNKRHVETNQQPEKDNTYENRSALSNYEKP